MTIFHRVLDVCKTRPLVPVLIFVALLPAFVGMESPWLDLASLVLIYGLAVISLDLLLGFGGQLSLGHAGFLAVGAYVAALTFRYAPGTPFILELLMSGLITAFVGLVLGLPTTRLKGHYLALATLGFGLMIPQLALNFEQFTGGFAGIPVPPLQIGSEPLQMLGARFYFIFAIVLICILAIARLLNTGAGRAFMAVRDGEPAALAMGINVWRTKLLLFMLSAFFCGVAGNLFAHYNGLVAPSSFPFLLSAYLLAAVLVGGRGSLIGGLLGGAFLAFLQQRTAQFGAASELVAGIVVILMIVLRPNGLVSLFPSIGEWLVRRRDGKPARMGSQEQPLDGARGCPGSRGN